LLYFTTYRDKRKLSVSLCVFRCAIVSAVLGVVSELGSDSVSTVT
jgi:hypothetical protein